MTCSSMRAPGTNCGTGADGQVPAEEAAHDSEHEKTWKRWTCGAPYHWATWSGALRGYSERQKRDSWPLASDDTVKHGNQEDREETGENENDHADERPGALSMATPRRTATVPRGPRPPQDWARRLIRIRGELRKNDRTLAAQDLVEFARLPGFIGGSVKEQHLEAGKWLSRRPAMTFSHAVAYLMWPKSDALPRDAELISRRAAHLDGIAVSRVSR